MNKVKAIVFGIGEMGKLTAKLMVEKGVEIVGAIDVRAHIGEDIGEVIGLDHLLNVKVSGDIDTVLDTTSADVAVICARSYIDEMYPFFKKFIEKNLNIATLAEETFYSWRLYPEKTEELDQMAKAHGVTLASGGIQDFLWLNQLIPLSGASHKMDSVLGQATSNVDNYGPAAIEAIGVGQTEAEFKDRIKNQKFDYSFFGITMEAIIAGLGLKLSTWKEWVEPVLCKEDTVSKGLGKTIPAGLVIGWNQVTEIMTEEGIKFRSEFISKICMEGEPECSRWSIKGVPDLCLDTPNVPGPYAICASLVNRIPDIINSDPGFITMEKLPQLKYRAKPLHFYVNKS